MSLYSHEFFTFSISWHVESSWNGSFLKFWEFLGAAMSFTNYVCFLWILYIPKWPVALELNDLILIFQGIQGINNLNI